MTQQQFELNQEREAELYRVLDECYEHGVSQRALVLLCHETGARWVPPDVDVKEYGDRI